MTPQEANQKLFEAAEAGAIVHADAALAAGADPNARDNEQRTPLHWAVWAGDTELVRLLIDKGGDVKVQDEQQQTPLHWAAGFGDTDVARLLIEKDADPNAWDKWQQTTLYLADAAGHRNIVVLFRDAARGSHAGRVAKGRDNSEPQVGG